MSSHLGSINRSSNPINLVFFLTLQTSLLFTFQTFFSHIISELPSSLSSSSSNISIKSPKSKSPSSSCQEKIVIQPGCEIVDRRCQCWMNPINVCRESSLVKWDFVNIEVRKVWYFFVLYFW